MDFLIESGHSGRDNFRSCGDVAEVKQLLRELGETALRSVARSRGVELEA